MVIRRRRRALWWGLGMVAASACNCPQEELTETICSFTVAPHDLRADSPPGVPNGPLLFGEVRKGDRRERSITVSNKGSNVPLTNLTLTFSELTADSYSVPMAIPEIPAGEDRTIAIAFSPVPIDTEVGNTLTVSHPRIDEAACPTWTVTLRGRALPPLPVDAGPPDAAMPDAAGGDDGGTPDAGRDAGPLVPRDDAGIPLSDAGHFEARGGLQVARTQFGAGLLPSGDILVAGGFDHAGQVTASTEILDPRTGVSRAGPPLTTARARHSVSVLADGTVVVFGGVDNGASTVATVLSSVEVLAPNGTAFQTFTVSEKRADHVAVAVEGGVLVAWGLTSSGLGQPLTPAAGAFLLTAGGMLTPVASDGAAAMAREGAAVVDLGLQGVLLLGGRSGLALRADVVRFQAGGLSTLALALPEARAFASAARFQDGPVVVAGGVTAQGPALRALQLDVMDSNPANWSFSEVDQDLEPRLSAHMFRALDDVLVVAGGLADSVADGGVLARADGTLFVRLPGGTVLATAAPTDLSVPRVDAQVVAYDGGIAVVGGSVTSPRRSARPDVDRFVPSQTRFESMGALGPGAAGTLAPGGKVLLAGGVDLGSGRATARTRLYDMMDGAFTEGPRLLVARTEAMAALLPNGDLLVAGGMDAAGNVLNQAERVRGDFSGSVPVGRLSQARRGATVTVLPDERVLLCGGYGTGSAPLDTCELFRPDQDTFLSASGRMVRGRAAHTATLLDSGRVLLTGGNDPALAPFRGDLFDPAENRVRATTGAPMAARRGHVAVLLGQGRVMLAGGETYVGERVPTNTVEVFDEATETYGSLMPMNEARDSPVGVLFVGGLTLVTGGAQSVTADATFPTRALRRSELFEPATGAFRNLDLPLTFPRAGATGTDAMGFPLVHGGEGRHGLVSSGLEARVPLTTVEVWVP